MRRVCSGLAEVNFRYQYSCPFALASGIIGQRSKIVAVHEGADARQKLLRGDRLNIVAEIDGIRRITAELRVVLTSSPP